MPRQKNPENVEVELSRPDADGILDILIEKAYDFADEKEVLYKKIQANRRSLRDLRDQGALTAEQAQWVDEFYTPRAPRNGHTEDVPE